MKITIYVEGGGDDNDTLKTQCRRGFSEFMKKCGFAGRMPKIVACGSRDEAFKRFVTAQQNSTQLALPMLLVDSENPVTNAANVWMYLKSRDNWEKPSTSDDDQAHLMVQCMENWFLADRKCLAKFYGQGFNSNALPTNPKIEDVRKEDMANGLDNATRHCKKGKYHKGRHSFDILAQLDPNKVTAASPHAKRLVDTLKKLSS